jgi:hypothetical protein
MQKIRCKIHKGHCFLFYYEGISTATGPQQQQKRGQLHEHLNNRNARHTAGTPKKEWTLIKVETPGTERNVNNGMNAATAERHTTA